MVLKIKGHKFHYEMENLCRVFFPNENIKTIKDNSEIDNSNDDIFVETSLKQSNDISFITINAKIVENEQTQSIELNNNDDKYLELQMAILLYQLLSQMTNY